MTKAIAVILIVLGLIGLVWGGLSYTTKKTVVDIGPIEASRVEHHRLPIPPIAGLVVLVSGVGLLVVSKRS